MVEQVNFLDLGLVFHKAGERFHFLGRICVQTKVPVVALFVGKRRVNRCVVQIDDFFAGIAFVVFLYRISQSQSHTGAIALRNVAKTLIDCSFEDIQCFLRRTLAVHANNFVLHAGRVVFSVELLGQKLPGFQLVLSHVAKRA